jgi:hypothetical protein
VLYQSKASGYDPWTRYADFVVAEVPLGARPANSDEISVAETLATFGRPAREYYHGGYTILVYRQNLLNQLPPPQPRGTDRPPGGCRIISLLTCWRMRDPETNLECRVSPSGMKDPIGLDQSASCWLRARSDVPVRPGSTRHSRPAFPAGSRMKRHVAALPPQTRTKTR